jgi:hypothetical protein
MLYFIGAGIQTDVEDLVVVPHILFLFECLDN